MSRVVKFLGRTKAYFTECKHNMAPMPNPEWYEENAHTRVTIKNLRKLPLSVHAEVWRSSLSWYKDSFEESFAWGRRRKEQAKKQEAEEKMDVLQGLVKDAREATHNSPEDLEKSKVAIRELLEEIHENRDELKSVAQEKLDLIRLSLSEFSSGYREARDEEIKRVMAMDKSVLQSFLSERAGEVKRATSIISDAILDKDEPVGTTTTGRGQDRRSGDGAAGDRKGKPQDSDGRGGDDDVGGGPRSFLSERTRQAIDGVLHDPDVERLSGRMKGFARGRLLQAESAARVLKGEEEEAAGGGGRESGADQRPRRRQRPGAEGEDGERGEEGEGAPRMGSEGGSDDARGGGGGGGGGDRDKGKAGGETPIISGLANDASDFLAERVGRAKEGAKEVMAAASEVRQSRRAAAAAAADRPAKAAPAEENRVESEQKEGSARPDRGKEEKDPPA